MTYKSCQRLRGWRQVRVVSNGRERRRGGRYSQPTPRMLSRCRAPWIIVRVDTIICHGVYRSVEQDSREPGEEVDECDMGTN